MTVNFENLAAFVQADDVVGLSRNVNAPAISGVDANGRSLLFLAAANGATDAGLFLLDSKKIDANAVDVMGETALMRAATNGDVALVKGLLEAGAELNQVATVTGGTALHSAYAGGERAVKAVEALIEAGADQTIEDKLGRVPQAWAAEGQAIDLAAKSLVDGQVVNPEAQPRRAPRFGR